MSAAYYRPRYYTVKAIQWLGVENCPEVFAFLDMQHSDEKDDAAHTEIFGIGDNETAHPGDWIVRDPDGRERVMSDEDFRFQFEGVGHV